LQSKSGIFGEKFNETSRKKGFPIAKALHRNKSNVYPKLFSMKKIITLCWFSLAVTPALTAQQPGCDGSRYLDDVFTGVKKTTVVYAPTVSHLGQNINLSVDIYEPEGDNLAKRPVVILAHGGSFVFGDKSNMQKWCQLLAKKGYVAASIQYRLFPWFTLGFPDSIGVFDTAVKAVGDMNAAVRFFREDAATNNTFRADPEHIFVGGYSAGAVTALHKAYLDADDPIPAFLQNLINSNGGTEGISGSASNKTYSSASEAVVNMSGGLYRSNWVGSGDQPLVSIHGTADGTVPYTSGLANNIAFLEGSSAVHTSATAAGVWNSLLTVPGGGHTDIYEQAQWKPFIDSFWVITTSLLESLVCAESSSLTDLANEVGIWEIFPNPVGGNRALTVKLGDSGTAATQFVVMDMLGKVVFQTRIDAVESQQVQLPAMASGLYLAQIRSQNKRFEVKRLLVD
jgi:acetyl esterase/lipase